MNTVMIRASNHPHARPCTITKVASPMATVPVAVPSRSSGGGRSITVSSAMNRAAIVKAARRRVSELSGGRCKALRLQHSSPNAKSNRQGTPRS